MDHQTVISREAQRLTDLLLDADPEARVPTCPDWNTTDLLWHLTTVHAFWARIIAENPQGGEVGAIEADEPARPDTMAEMASVRAAATADLIAALGAVSDDEPRWTWSAEQTAGFTRRMQVCEATMHRVDAELTAGVPVSPIAADVAALCVSHAIDAMWAWLPEWGTYEPLTVVEFVASDTGQRWPVEIGHWTGVGPESGTAWDLPRAIPATGGAASATATAPLVDLALWAWRRQGVADVSGDPRAVAALDALLEMGMS